MNLRNFSIRTRMYGAIAMVLVLLALVGVTGIWGLQTLDARSAAFVATTFEHAQSLSGLRHELGNVRRFEKDIALNFENAAALGGYLTQWQAATTSAMQHAKAMSSGASADQATIARQIADGLSLIHI